MKWFRHMSSASDDEFISGIEDLFGWEGYGRWWKLLEIIAKQMDETDRCHAEYSWVKWQSFLKGKRNKLETFLVHCQNKRKIKLEQNGDILRIICPKLLELRDNYTKDLQATSINTSKQEVDVEVDKKEEEDSAKAALWKLCRSYLGEKKMSLVGKWAKNHPEEKIYAAVLDAQKNQVADPVAYIQKILDPPNWKDRPGNRMPSPAGG